LGQNFLVDGDVARKIVEAAGIGGGDAVIEIGPGHGILTRLMAPVAGQIIAVEIDRYIAEEVRRKFAAAGNVTVVQGDFMKFPLPPEPCPPSLKFVSNLPYYIATAILQRILPLSCWQSAVVMVQLEVAERIVATAGRQYGYMSLFCRYFSDVKLLFKVSPGSFSPPPKVTSAILKFENRHPVPPPAQLFALIKRAFHQRRKTILNSISNNTEAPKEAVLEALATVGINPKSRPEELTLESYLRLTSILGKYIISDTANSKQLNNR